MSHHSAEHSLASLLAEAPSVKEELVKNIIGDAAEQKTMLMEKHLTDTLGPTKDFPHGRIVPHDEGGLMFGVTVFNGRVIFDFGKPVRSIGFTREGALELAELIKQRAEQCPAVFFPRRAGDGR